MVYRPPSNLADAVYLTGRPSRLDNRISVGHDGDEYQVGRPHSEDRRLVCPTAGVAKNHVKVLGECHKVPDDGLMVDFGADGEVRGLGSAVPGLESLVGVRVAYRNAIVPGGQIDGKSGAYRRFRTPSFGASDHYDATSHAPYSLMGLGGV